jgi:hypothetical protein
MTLNLHPQLPGLTLYKVAGIVPALDGFGNRVGLGGCFAAEPSPQGFSF